MEEIISLFKRLKKSKSHQNGLNLDLASPSSANNSFEETSNDLQKAKFKLRRPRLTSPTERKIQNRKKLSPVTSEVTPNEVFADEDDLFADRDDGVYMQSSSTTSSSPAASERLQRPASKLHGKAAEDQPQRPASCTFGSDNTTSQRLFQPRTTFQTQAASVQREYNMSRPASACSMVSALIASNDQGQLCPVCGCHYDSGKQRKLVDTNCGHARCFKCMFNVEQCPMCLPTKKHQSCISRESGFQSFNGSVSSIYTCDRPLNGNEMEMDDRQSSTGSLLSLMSAQSALNMMAPPSVTSRYSMYDSTPSFNRVDQKRHSLTSLSRYQPPSASSSASISSRNSYMRRSAIIPRNNRRSMMTSIMEHQQTFDNENWPLKPLFFEIPPMSSTTFVGRKWLFREVLEHLSSDLPTSGGMIIQGAQATGKSSIILRLVQGSCFGHQAPCMSNCIDILARDVVAFHFCQLDDEPTCTIPEFVHNLAAQLSRCPQLSNFRSLLSSNPEFMSNLTYLACLENPSRALIKGILEPLTILRSQGKISGQRCLLLIDSLCDSEYHRTDSGETLTSFLASHLQFFPRWLRIICTVRSNMIDIMKPYPFHRLSLDNLAVDERIYKDVQDLVFQRIRESVLTQKNITPANITKPEEIKLSQTNFAHYVIQASRGNFLYIDLVLAFFKEGKLQVKSSSFSMIPMSLSQVFLLAFNLKYPTHEAFLKVKDLICIMAASLRPLTHSDLFDCINALKMDSINQDLFQEKIKALNWLLKTKANGQLAFFHPTIRDWLIGRRLTNESNGFVCDPREGHAAIALKLSRQSHEKVLGPEETLELGHHLLKANLFRANAKDLQAAWLAIASRDTTMALAHVKNVATPNVKVSRLLLLAGAVPPPDLILRFAERGNLEMIQLCAEFGANLNACDPQMGTTALMKASSSGHFDLVDLLVKSGAELNATDSKGSTALVYAAKTGHNDIVQFLISWPSWPSVGCTLSITAREALVVSASKGHLDVLETLINHPEVEVNEPCLLSGEVGLYSAASQGQLESCQLLIKAGKANVNLINEKNGNSPLFIAVKEGHYAIVDLLLNHGALLERCRQNPVSVAAAEGQVGVLELLLTREANKDAADAEGLTPLAFAVIRGQTRALDLLIKAGADTKAVDKNKRSLLHHASLVKNCKMVEMLIDCGIDIEAMDKDGIRAIDSAIGHANEAVVASLLRKGAKLGPTTWAMAKGKPRIALILLNKLLEDGNTLFRKGRLTDAAYRYEYALRRLPRLRPCEQPQTSASSEDIFAQLKTHLLLNLSRTKRKLGEFSEAEICATQVINSRPSCHEAWWARAKARSDQDQLKEALSDLREALKLAPQNLELHAFSSQVKNQLEAKQRKLQQKEIEIHQEEDPDEIETLEVISDQIMV